MKKLLLFSLGLALPAVVMAQGAVDAYTFSQPDMKGTARFMSMGGAFTALGGDLSSISQNPAGIGVYRNSEIGFTVDFDIQNSKSETLDSKNSINQFKFLLNNAGYIGSVRLGNGILKNFNWGFTYNKAASFNRKYSGRMGSLPNSMSNYIAGMSNQNGVTPGDVRPTETYDPYNPNDGKYEAPWLSILGYQSWLINPTTSNGQTKWSGLWGNDTYGSGYFNAIEQGGVDEYNISFGGNFANLVYWGMDFGITDLNYTVTTLWGENLSNAYIENGDAGITRAKGSWDLYNYYNVNGTGFNYKLGVIIRPIQEFRIGIAFHTPTWYSMEEYYYANTEYNYDVSNIRPGSAETNNGLDGYWEYKFHTPWKLTVGAAAVIANRFIVSADYEWNGYQGMHFSPRYNNFWSDQNDPYYYANNDIKDYYQSTSSFRIGAEARLTSNLSLRLGYNHTGSPVKEAAKDNSTVIQTAGTRPSYSFDNSIDYITMGLGYRYKKFYLDMAYVHKHRSSEWHAYTPSSMSESTPQAKIASNDDQIVVSMGFKF